MYSRVYVEIINMCNMDCSFCHGHSREPGIMDMKEFTRVLDQLEGKTKYIYFHLMGEPLTHPEILRFISTAKARGFFPMITTNGTLLGSWSTFLCTVLKRAVRRHLQSTLGRWLILLMRHRRPA